ncbi:methyltransferase domain-containing protein [Flammeovirga aprica JL-4]|uniref:Methyltransferase domain-containing protein n=2 Tax=Flammeovirga aprica TaxID=29528 RepID=A0A7X9XCW4_9BACT|nr:methyltransferase domain-containing protein [Flammeovirga aprica JL-4]
MTTQTMDVESIEQYYDECNRDYEIVWQLKNSLALHYGYWDENTLTHRQALWNTNFQVAKHGRITKSDKVLDAGCGVGGTSFFLAKHIGCEVHGITLSPHQLKQAQNLQEELDPAGLTTFSCMNYCETDFPDATFDAVIAIESAMYSEPKNAFLEEAYRILKPGGRIVLADYYIIKEEQSDKEKKVLKNWAESWVIKDFTNEKAYHNDLASIGYENLNAKDVSDQVWPSIKLMNRSYYPGILISKVSNFFRFRTSLQVENSKSGKYQYQAFELGLWRYKYLCAYKPTGKGEVKSKKEFVGPSPYIDQTPVEERFPILKNGKLHVRNILKRTMHYYLEKGIRNSKRKF